MCIVVKIILFKVVLCTLFQKLNLYLKTELFTLEHIIKPKAGHVPLHPFLP